MLSIHNIELFYHGLNYGIHWQTLLLVFEFLSKISISFVKKSFMLENNILDEAVPMSYIV